MSQFLRKSADEAKRAMRQQDNDRARLLKSFFYADIDDALRYDCVWNTGLVTFEAIAEAIIVLLKQRVSV